MLNKQQKLDAIYEAMADQTLSAGCAVEFRYKNGAIMEYGWDEDAGGEVINIEYVNSKGYTDGDFNFPISDIKDGWDEDLESHIKIIGHPVRIGDVLDYITVSFFEKYLYWYRVSVSRLLPRWDKPRLPINEQSEECIDFVYSLIKK